MIRATPFSLFNSSSSGKKGCQTGTRFCPQPFVTRSTCFRSGDFNNALVVGYVDEHENEGVLQISPTNNSEGLLFSGTSWCYSANKQQGQCLIVSDLSVNLYNISHAPITFNTISYTFSSFSGDYGLLNPSASYSVTASVDMHDAADMIAPPIIPPPTFSVSIDPLGYQFTLTITFLSPLTLPDQYQLHIHPYSASNPDSITGPFISISC
jgi:hypothetical protein